MIAGHRTLLRMCRMHSQAPCRKVHSTSKPIIDPHVALGCGSAMGVFAGATGLAGAIIGHPVLNNFSRLSPHLVTGTLCLATSSRAASGAGTFLDLGCCNVTGLSGLLSLLLSVILNQCLIGAFAVREGDSPALPNWGTYF